MDKSNTHLIFIRGRIEVYLRKYLTMRYKDSVWNELSIELRSALVIGPGRVERIIEKKSQNLLP